MATVFQRTALIPVWMIALGVFAIFGPVTVATGALVLTIGLVAAGIMLGLWRDPTPTIAEVLHRVDRRTGRS